MSTEMTYQGWIRGIKPPTFEDDLMDIDNEQERIKDELLILVARVHPSLEAYQIIDKVEEWLASYSETSVKRHAIICAQLAPEGVEVSE